MCFNTLGSHLMPLLIGLHVDLPEICTQVMPVLSLSCSKTPRTTTTVKLYRMARFQRSLSVFIGVMWF